MASAKPVFLFPCYHGLSVCGFLPSILNSGVAFSSHTGISLHQSISFFTSGSLRYCVHLILRCSNAKPLNSFSIFVAGAFRHYLSSDLYLTYKCCNFCFRGGKIISFISAANILHKVWRAINHAGSLMASYYRQDGIWRHQGPKYILHFYVGMLLFISFYYLSFHWGM